MDAGNYENSIVDGFMDRLGGANRTCDKADLSLLRDLYNTLFNLSNCSTPSQLGSGDRDLAWVIGHLFHAYFTPFVFVIGIIGNCLSLGVFLSKSMRHLSASTYLSALSVTDLMALLFYVLVEWLIRGYPVISSNSSPMTFINFTGMCQVIMYLHYVSRFMSSWLVVAFTIERYIGVCHPFRRRHICSLTITRRIVVGIVVLSFLFNIFKPLLSVVQHVDLHGQMCTTDPRHRLLSFILDSVYAVSITFFPFVVITMLNICIIRQLYLHNRQQRIFRVVTQVSVIHLEFTSILLVVSFCFVAFNLPYFATWCKLFLTSNFIRLSKIEELHDFDYFRGVALFTRAIYYTNYCINFFLYSITGAYFRRGLKNLFVSDSRKNQVVCGMLKRKRRFSSLSMNGNPLASKSSDGKDSVKYNGPPSVNDTWV